MESLQKVRDIPVDVVLGNHPRQNETLVKRERMLREPGTNPFVDKQEWQRFVDQLTVKFIEFMDAGN